MADRFICVICDKPEEKCSCERYCCYCKAQYNVRLCEDGQFYCQPCREACDMQAQA